MAGPNREAFGPALARLGELARGARPGGLAAVADELLGVATVLESEPRLRRALADPSRPAQDRAALLSAVIDGKVSADAADLLRTLVADRWSSGTDLLTAVERLGVEALLAGAESSGELADVEDELFRFGQIVGGDLRLASALGATSTPAAQRAELAKTLLEGRAKPATVRLVTVALHGFGGRGVAGSLTRLVELAAARRDRQVAYVTVAAPIGEAEIGRLSQRLSQIYGRSVEIKVTVAPEVLGGVSVRVGDDLYDGTVRRRLNETRAALVAKR